MPQPQEHNIAAIQARQQGRHSELGPQPGQEFVRTAAFLFARADIDELLAEVIQLRTALQAIAVKECVTPDIHFIQAVDIARRALT